MDIEIQKKKLEQRKAKLQQQETLLKLKERKVRLRHLIEVGGIVAKAEIDHLSSDVLLGACLFIKESIEKDESVLNSWGKLGAEILKNEIKDKVAIILKINVDVDPKIRIVIREAGLKWNTLRKEWYGYISDLSKLKQNLKGLKFNIEVLEK